MMAADCEENLRARSSSQLERLAAAVQARLGRQVCDLRLLLRDPTLLSQVLLLSIVYGFTRVDWRAAFEEHKFKWLAEARKVPRS